MNKVEGKREKENWMKERKTKEKKEKLRIRLERQENELVKGEG